MAQGKSPQTATSATPAELPLWLRREVPAAGLLLLSLLTALAVVAPNGVLGPSWASALRVLFGQCGVLLALVLAAFGAAILRERHDALFHFGASSQTGWIVAFAAALALAAGAGDAAKLPRESSGGALGALLWSALAAIGGQNAAAVAVTLVAVVGLALALGATRSTPVDAIRAGLRSATVLPRRLTRVLFPPRPTPAADLPDEPMPVIARQTLPPVSAPDVPRPGQRPADGEWLLPPAACLQEVTGAPLSQAEIERKANLIVQAFADFDVHVRVTAINPGPTVTQYGVEPGFRERRDKNGAVVRREKIKVNEITSLSNDLALALAAPSIRIEAPVPGRDYVGIEVPNSTSTVVNLQRIVSSPQFVKVRGKSRLAVALGENVSGEPVAADLAKMPHLLVAGQTGSGKSVCINSIITSLLLNATPDELRLILVDPKRVELTGYNDVPHLLRPVVVEADKVVSVLKWVVKEMETRYKLFEQLGVRNIDGYNKLCDKQPELSRMHYIVVVIDELADLMMLAPADTERLVCRLAQLARATGIHLIVATQRPSVDVITGLIKANFPTRISFAVASQVDSRTILDSGGAEKLLGRGDMLFLPQEAPKAIRVQGTYVSDDEIASIVDWWKEQGAPDYVDELVNAATYDPNGEDETDEYWEKAVALAQESRVSTSFLQRKLRVGYNRAARLIDRLEEEGLLMSSEEVKLAKEAKGQDEADLEPDQNGPVHRYTLPRE